MSVRVTTKVTIRSDAWSMSRRIKELLEAAAKEAALEGDLSALRLSDKPYGRYEALTLTFTRRR